MTITALLSQGAQAVQSGHEFWNIDLGNLLVLLGLVGSFLKYETGMSKRHGENKQQIEELVKWKESHEDDARQRDIAISKLQTIAGAMEATARAMQAQVKLVQEELRDNRNWHRRGPGKEGQS